MRAISSTYLNSTNHLESISNNKSNIKTIIDTSDEYYSHHQFKYDFHLQIYYEQNIKLRALTTDIPPFSAAQAALIASSAL